MLQKEKNKIAKADRGVVWWKLAASVLIVVLVVMHIGHAYGVSTLSDEFGYWGTAATLSGFDWSGTLSNFPYYSFIYSLVLWPVMLLPVGATAMFRIALVFNAVMLVITFWISYACTKRMYPMLPGKFCTVVCAAVTLYSANIYNSQNTSGEVLNLLLFWVLFYVCLRFAETPKMCWATLLGLLAVLNFAAHMRSVSLLATVVIVLGVTLLHKRVKIKTFLGSVLIAGAGVIVFNQIKDLILEYVYQAGELSTLNDVGAQTQKVTALFDPKTLYDVFVMCWGRLFYLGTASFLLIYIGIITCAVAASKMIRRRIQRMPNEQHAENVGMVALFLLLSLLFSIGVSSVFILDPGDRIVYLYYGRYTEYLAGPLFIIGFVSLYRFTKKERKIVCPVMLFHFLLCIWMYLYMRQNRMDKSAPYPNIAAVSGMPVLPGLNTQLQYTFGIAIEAILIFIVLCGIIWFPQKNKLGAAIKLYGAPVLLGTVWTLCGINYIYNSLYTKEKIGSQKNIAVLADSLESTVGNQTVTFPYGGVAFEGGSLGMVKIQFLAPHTKIQMVNMENAAEQVNWENVPYLLWAGNEDYPKDLIKIKDTQYIGVAWADNLSYYVRVSDENAVAASLRARWAEPMPVSLQSVERADQTWMEQDSGNGWVEVKAKNVKEDQDKNYAINTGKPTNSEGGYAIFGPYLTLSPGQYQVTFTLELLDSAGETEKLGTCDVSSNGGRALAAQTLSKADFSNGNSQQITLDFETGEKDLTGVEFRLYVEPGVQFRVTDISYQCTGLERQAILPGTEDYSMLLSVLGYDTESLPLQIAVDDAMLPYVSCSQLQEELGRAHEVSLVGISEMVVPETPTILLVPADETELLFDLLPRDTVLVRLNEYAVVVPSGYSIERNFVEAGGQTLSDGDRLNVRYFQGTGKSNYGSINATIPAGEYDLSYRVDVLGTPLWGDLGTLSIRGGSINVSESLSPDMFTYGVYEGSRALTMEDSGQLSMQLTTRSGITVTRMEAYLSRRG